MSLVFRNVDASHQGKFDAEDLVFYFQKLGIKLELDEAKKLVEKYANCETFTKKIIIEYLEWIKIIHCKYLLMNGVRFLWLIQLYSKA